MSSITDLDPQFIEDLDGLFNQMFKAAGNVLDQAGFERIREISEKLALTIEHRGEVKAIEVIKVLQRSVTNAFKALEADIDKRQDEVDAKIEALEARVDKLADGSLRRSRG